MTRARTWLSLSMLLAGLSTLTASCGSDEATGSDDDEDGGAMSAGRGGGGGGGRGGTAGRAGGGTGGKAAPGTLGESCTESPDCPTGLECFDIGVTEGLCSTECTAADECAPYGAGSLCLAETCIEGCTVGPEGLAAKCHDRTDLTCRIIEFTPGGACTETADCTGNQLCIDGACSTPIGGCLPLCGSNDDCAEGTFCNLETGGCDAQPKPGLPIGSACDQNAATDPCQGFCLALDDDTAFCSGYCRISTTFGGCGESDALPTADNACIWILPISGVGDEAFCGELCDCTADCSHPDLKCVPLDTDPSFTVRGRPGICSTADSGPTLDSCDGNTGGAGGAGGAGSAGESGAGGAPGAGGTSGGAGAGGADSGAGGDGGTATTEP